MRRCDPIGCVVDLPERGAASFVTDLRGFETDCARATIVLSRLAAPPACAATLVIDRAFLDTHGATAIRRGGTGFVVETSRDPTETRPWLRRDRRAGPRPSTVRPDPPPDRAGRDPDVAGDDPAQ